MSQSKPVKGTQNYVFFVQELLGRGAMGAVYTARQRKKGTKHAAKVFNPDPKYTEYIHREIEMLRNMTSHTNIVSLVAIEEETYSKEKVIIMELCDAGSLQNILDDPLNYYGLPQEEFLLVFKDTCRALHHLYDNHIIHRDIKPGNILLQKTSDGSHVYKLTDFGAAKKLNADDEGFKSICGTEEYLHPDLHSSAFIRRIPGVLFGHSVDLWSFGVTLYQCATGRLPFRPKDGVRHDKHMMNDLMTKKKARVISRYQTADGRIVDETELPRTTKLLCGTRHFVVDVLSRLFDTGNPWLAESFLHEMKDFCDRVEIYAYSFEMNGFITLFMRRDQCLIHLKEELSKFTPTVSSNQLLFTKDGPLESIITSQDRISSYPDTSTEDPIFVMGEKFTPHEANHRIHLPALPVSTPGLTTLTADAKWASEVCGNLYHYFYITSSRSLLQCHLYFMRTVLKDHIMNTCEKIEHFIWHQQQCQKYHSHLWKQAVSHIHKHHRHSQTSVNLQRRITSIDNNVEKCTIRQQRLQRQLEELQERLGKYTKIAKRGLKPSCVAPDRCKQKGEIIVQDALPMYRAIMEDKRAHDLPHNDMEIHKYNRSELKRTHRRFREYLESHCLLQSDLLYQETEEIIRDMLETRSALRQLESDVESFGERQERCGMDIVSILSVETNYGGADSDGSDSASPHNDKSRISRNIQSGDGASPSLKAHSKYSMMVLDDSYRLQAVSRRGYAEPPTSPEPAENSSVKTGSESYFNHLLSQQSSTRNGLTLPSSIDSRSPTGASNWPEYGWQPQRSPTELESICNGHIEGRSKYIGRSISNDDDSPNQSNIAQALDTDTVLDDVNTLTLLEKWKNMPSGS